MVVACYIKLFWKGADRHNGILMSLLLLVPEPIEEITKITATKNLTLQNLPTCYFFIIIIITFILI